VTTTDAEVREVKQFIGGEWSGAAEGGTFDTNRGFALAQQLESGIVHVNDQPVGDEPQMPFGGVKDSGWGRFGGQAVVDELTELRWITVQGGSGHPFPF
jgi:acyl-CoA reductase-like NAD-dependent aldehyde dehydrogenase